MDVGSSFAEMLIRHLECQDRSFSWLAKQLGVAPSTVTRWTSGYTAPESPDRVIAIADLLHIHERKERQRFLAAAGFGYVEQSSPSVAQTEVPGQFAELLNVMDALRIFMGKWANRLGFGPKKGRWEVRLLSVAQNLAGNLTPPRLLALLFIAGMWITTYWLVDPILHWPLVNNAQQMRASTLFGSATLLIPLLVALFLRVDARQEEVAKFSLATSRQSAKLLLIKFVGALAGFYIFSFIVIAVALIVFYLRGRGVSGSITALLVALPLFSSYVCGYVVAAKRLALVTDIRLYTVDRLALVAFLLAGPATAAFLYFQREMLQNRYFAIILFVLLFSYALWAYKQQFPSEVPDSLLIFMWGLLFPCVLLFIPFWTQPELAQNVNLATLVVFAIHVIGQGVLIATIYVGKQARIFWPFLLWVLMLELLAILVLSQNATVGAMFLGGAALVFGIVWLLGKGILHHHLAIHDSFWVMQIVFVASLLTWGYGLLPPWAVATLYCLITTALIKWAHDHTAR